MEDDGLEAIRQQRLAELQRQHGGGQEGMQGPSPEQQEEMARKQMEQKHALLSQVLDQDARTRLNTLAIAKPDKAKMIEGMLIQMARTGQITPGGKLKDSDLVRLLEDVNRRTSKSTTVKFDRRRVNIDDDDDF